MLQKVDIPASKVYIGNVSNGQVSTEFAKSLIDLIITDIAKEWYFWRAILWGRSGVNIIEKRNNTIRDFLKTPDGEWLLLLDSDMVFPSETIPRLLHAASQADAQVVGGLCVVVDDKLGPFPTLFHIDTQDGSYLRAQLDYPVDSILQVDATGAACLMVHRDVLESVRQYHLDNRVWLEENKESELLSEMGRRGLINVPTQDYGWFSEHPAVTSIQLPDGEVSLKEHWIGEDLDFCLRIGSLGYGIFVDCGLEIGHHKEDRIWYPRDIKEGLGFRRPKIAAVIPVKDKLDLTRNLINQIRKDHCDEIVVCDNGSDDETKEWLAAQDDITVIDCPDIGINAMWNRGIDHVLQKFDHKAHIAFLNNDLILGDGFLDKLSLGLFRNSEMIAVSGNYDDRHYTGEIQEVTDICANRYDGTGGLAGFAFMVRSEWFSSGYRFPEECMWWFGDNHLMEAIRIGNTNTKDIPRKAGIVISATVEHIDGGGGTAGDVLWSDFSEQLEKDEVAYNKFWKDYWDSQLKMIYEYLCTTESDIYEHLPTFVELCEKLEAKNVIELGVRTGVSTMAWLYGLTLTDGHLYSVDINPAPSNITHDRWTFLQGDDLDEHILSRLPDDADIVFVDTDHRYELTQAEIATYSLKVRPGGCMVFHDINVKQFDHHVLGSQPLYPVRKAVLEWVEENDLEITTYENCYGLAVVWMQ